MYSEKYFELDHITLILKDWIDYLLDNIFILGFC